jgi:methionine synthase I (cobalamin-dependent)
MVALHLVADDTPRAKPALADGAYGTLLARHLRPGEVADQLCTRQPDRVVDAHRAYLEVGSRELHTVSFMAFTLPAARRRQAYVDALECARAAVGSVGGVVGRSQVHVVATMGPAGLEPRALWADIELLLERDVTDIACLTVHRPDAARAFVRAFSEVADGTQSRATLGLTVAPSRGPDSWRWVRSLEFPSNVTPALNCCEGPAGLRPVLEHLADQAPAVRLAPSAGLPEPGVVPRWPCEPEPWAQAVVELAAGLPMASVGGCCGTTPDHIEALAAALDT